MEYRRFRCHACKKLKPECVTGQRYCSDPACQKARKNAWRRQKYATDPDYRLNQKQSTKAWFSSRGGAAAYYRDYRMRRKATGPPMAQSEGSQKTTFQNANSDATLGKSLIKTGRYLLYPEGANSDAIWVQISAISTSYDSIANIY
jgi:hypothetical protein